MDCHNEACKRAPQELKDKFFNIVFKKEFKCPIEDEKVHCLYSKQIINWDEAILMVEHFEKISRKKSD